MLHYVKPAENMNSPPPEPRPKKSHFQEILKMPTEIMHSNRRINILPVNSDLIPAVGADVPPLPAPGALGFMPLTPCISPPIGAKWEN